MFTPRSKKIFKNIGFWVPGPIQLNRYLKDMSIPDKNIKNECTSAEKRTKMFFWDMLSSMLVGCVITWFVLLLVIACNNQGLHSLVGMDTDLTTRAPGFDSPLPPKPVATGRHSLQVFFPHQNTTFKLFTWYSTITQSQLGTARRRAFNLGHIPDQHAQEKISA